MKPDPNLTRSAGPGADPHTDTFDPTLDAGLAAAFGPDLTPGGWTQPPLLRDDPSDNSPLVQPSSTEMPRSGPDRYQLLGEIARGGMGVILKGRDPDLGRDLAVKVLKAELAGKPAAEQRFVEEAQVGGQLQHPGVVPVYDLGRFADGRPYFAMKLVKGRTLAEMLAERPDPSADRGRFLHDFLKVCQTIAYAHSKGVIHRDLKPSNVMIGAFGEVLVMDWGLAKVLPRGGVADEENANRQVDPGGPSEEPTVIHTARSGGGSETVAGAVLGTPAFMSPEQAGGEVDKVDERADVFGLGAILCVILTGRPPYVGADGDSVRRMAVRGELAGCVSRLDACGADAELVALCKRCLAADLDGRPRQAGEVVAAVAAHLAEIEGRAHRAEVARAAAEARAAEEANTRRLAEAKAREERRRRRADLALAASLALLLLGGGAFAWWQDHQAGKAKRARAEHDAAQARLEGERRVEQAKAQAAEARAYAGVDAALALAADLRKKYRFGEAGTALDQAGGLIPADGPAELRQAVRQAAADLAFVHQLDEIRIKRSVWIQEEGAGGRFDEASAPPAYRAAFLARGLDVAGDPPGAVADRIRASAVRPDLVAALDDWAVFEPDPALRQRVLEVARYTDPGPWLDRFRDPQNRQDRAKLEALAAEADPAALAPGTLTALAELMTRRGLDPTRLLEAAQFAHPSDFQTAFALGHWLQFHQQDPASAIGHYRAARVIRPGHLAVLNNLGRALRLAKGNLDVEIACYREALRLNPHFSFAHVNLGTALYRRGDRPGAIDCYRKALGIDPKDPVAHTALGVALRDEGAVNESIAHCLRAIELAPDLAYAHYSLGRAYYLKRELGKAIDSYQKAIDLDRNLTEAYFHMGNAYFIQKKLGEAITWYRRALDTNPAHPEAHNNLGLALYHLKRYDEAIAAYREAVRHNPKFAYAHTNLGNALDSRGDRKGAIDAYKEALRADPGYAPAHYNLGVALYRDGDLGGAIACFEEALRHDEKHAMARDALDQLRKLKTARDAREGRIAPPPREVKR